MMSIGTNSISGLRYMCILGFEHGMKDTWVLGDVLFRNTVVSSDVANRQIGFE